MGAQPLPVDPFAVFDISEMNGQLASVTVLYAASIPATAAALPAVAIVAGGAYLETKLLQNKQWDDFWIAAGGKLNDVWHSVSGTLFGRGSDINRAETMGMIRLGLHVSMRASRQLITSAAARSAAITGALYKGVLSVANTVRNLTTFTVNHLNQLNADMRVGDRATRNYVDARLNNVGAGIQAQINHSTNALRAEMIRDILNPLHTSVVRLGTIANTALGEAHTLESQMKRHVLPELAAATLIGKQALTMAKQAKQWEDDCGEPMCQTMGPKTDLGKLLKRTNVAAILALLAAIAALDPDTVENASEEFGRLFGPVLSRWAEGWLGITHDAVSGIPGEVAHDVGKLFGGIIP